MQHKKPLKGKQTETQSKRTYSVAEVAELLGVGYDSARLGVTRGEIPAFRVGRRWLVPRAALDALLSGAGKLGNR